MILAAAVAFRLALLTLLAGSWSTCASLPAVELSLQASAATLGESAFAFRRDATPDDDSNDDDDLVVQRLETAWLSAHHEIWQNNRVVAFDPFLRLPAFRAPIPRREEERGPPLA